MVYYPQIKPERGITMKKLALVVAAALALTACTAAPTETATVPAAADPPAEAATAEESAAAEQFPVGELRLCDDWRRDTDTAYYTLYGDVDTTELTGLRLDYADGVQTKIMSLAIADALYSDLLVTNDNVVRVFLANADGSEFRFRVFTRMAAVKNGLPARKLRQWFMTSTRPMSCATTVLPGWTGRPERLRRGTHRFRR